MQSRATRRPGESGSLPEDNSPLEEAPHMLRNRDLALRSSPVLDLPPRTARLILCAGFVGVVLVFVQSLVGNRPETVGVDKVLHFSGYATLAAVFVLALRPRHAVPAVLILGAVSYLIELLQPLNMRSLDLGDAAANTLGLAIGAAAGLIIRIAYGYVRTELSVAHVRRNLIALPRGATVLRAGEQIDRFYIIKRGEVALYHEHQDGPEELDRLGPGEMFGLLAEIERTPQPVTVVAVSDVQLYRIDYDELIDAAGGPEQPLGAVLRYMATELRQASDRVAELQRRERAHVLPAKAEPLPEIR